MDIGRVATGTVFLDVFVPPWGDLGLRVGVRVGLCRVATWGWELVVGFLRVGFYIMGEYRPLFLGGRRIW